MSGLSLDQVVFVVKEADGAPIAEPPCRFCGGTGLVAEMTSYCTGIPGAYPEFATGELVPCRACTDGEIPFLFGGL
jgi:hypothetical protein